MHLTGQPFLQIPNSPKSPEESPISMPQTSGWTRFPLSWDGLESGETPSVWKVANPHQYGTVFENPSEFGQFTTELASGSWIHDVCQSCNLGLCDWALPQGHKDSNQNLQSTMITLQPSAGSHGNPRQNGCFFFCRDHHRHQWGLSLTCLKTGVWNKLLLGFERFALQHGKS